MSFRSGPRNKFRQDNLQPPFEQTIKQSNKKKTKSLTRFPPPFFSFPSAMKAQSPPLLLLSPPGPKVCHFPDGPSTKGIPKPKQHDPASPPARQPASPPNPSRPTLSGLQSPTEERVRCLHTYATYIRYIHTLHTYIHTPRPPPPPHTPSPFPSLSPTPVSISNSCLSWTRSLPFLTFLTLPYLTFPYLSFSFRIGSLSPISSTLLPHVLFLSCFLSSLSNLTFSYLSFLTFSFLSLPFFPFLTFSYLHFLSFLTLPYLTFSPPPPLPSPPSPFRISIPTLLSHVLFLSFFLSFFLPSSSSLNQSTTACPG